MLSFGCFHIFEHTEKAKYDYFQAVKASPYAQKNRKRQKAKLNAQNLLAYTQFLQNATQKRWQKRKKTREMENIFSIHLLIVKR